MITEKQKQEFLNGYLNCAAWAEGFEDFDFAKAEKKKACFECEQFIKENEADLILYAEKMESKENYTGFEMAGHDFWLTRNGHGAGFWDRGIDELGERLTQACKSFGECYVYKNHGKLHFE